MLNLLTRKKRKELDELLDDDFVLVFVNTQREGIDIPEQIRGLPSATLKLSRLFRGSLKLTDTSIETQLLFGSSYYECILPYDSIWAAKSADGREVRWQNETASPSPKEPSKTEEPQDSTESKRPPQGTQRSTPVLRRIK
jgi:hypothetical protein